MRVILRSALYMNAVFCLYAVASDAVLATLRVVWRDESWATVWLDRYQDC